jgi:WD40 repeat protein
LTQSSINAVKVSPNHNFIVTGGSDNFVRIWTIDSSELLFDFMLDSQVTGLSVNQEDLILVSTLNGSVGSIDIQNKLYKSLVRSHTDSITSVDYNSTKRLFVSVGLDQTIRLWDCRNKMSQCYEFQCLDLQPLVMKSYHLHHFILVGFKGGLVRLFDIHNNVFVKELTEAETDILSICLSPDDQFFVVAEAAGTLYIYDGQTEFRRRLLVEYEAPNFCLDIDYYCQSMIVSKNPFSLYLFSTNTWDIKQKVNVGEEILKAKFSYLKDKLLILTKTGKLRFYLASYYEVEFLKDFGCLHDGGVADFEVSLNCAYIFTIGLIDNSIKVWDYHFRGNLVPAFQCFSVNESPEFLKISNDEQGFVFTAGGNIINTWMFKNSFEDMKLKAHAEEIQKREHKLLELEQMEPIKHPVQIMQSTDTLTGGVAPKMLQDEYGHIVGDIYKNVSDQKELQKVDMGGGTATTRLPSSTDRPKNVRFQETHLTLDEEKQKRDRDFIDQEFEAITNPQKTDTSRALVPTQTEAASLKGKEDYDKFAHEMIRPEHIYGCQGMERGSLRWDSKHEYYVLTCSNKIVANYFNEEETQVVLDNVFMDNIKNLTLSSHSKYLVATMDTTRNEPSSGFSVYDGKSHTRLHSTRINSAEKILVSEISQKEDHLLLVFKPFETEYSFIQVWDILNNKRIVESAINDSLTAGKWNPYGIHLNEFVTISASKLYFWRLSRNSTLQYQTIIVNDQGGRVDKEYTAIAFYELSDQFKSIIIILGTSHGGLIFVDARSAVVLGFINSALNEHISIIECNKMVVNVSCKSPNIYSFFIPEESHKNMAKFMSVFETSPQIMSLDGKIGCINFPESSSGMEGLATTSAGSVWYLNWKDRLTIKLKSWHWYQKKLLCMEYNPGQNKIFTSAADFTIKAFSQTKNEEEVEFFVPNKGCLSMATSEDTLVCGFTDGTLR